MQFKPIDIVEAPPKNKMITFRLTTEQYRALRKIDANVSTVLRYMIQRFLQEWDDEKRKYGQWNKE